MFCGIWGGISVGLFSVPKYIEMSHPGANPRVLLRWKVARLPADRNSICAWMGINIDDALLCYSLLQRITESG